MRFIYNILFWCFLLLSAPYYLWRMQRRGNWQENFFERFGKYSTNLKQALTNRRTIWLHAVSVGEVNMCARLIEALRPRFINAKFVVSTTTTTGMQRLRDSLPAHVTKVYYPIDSRKAVYRAIATINPEMVILVEAEIWPNFIWRAKQLRVPLYLVNARLSPRSHPRYKRFGFLFRKLFGAFDGVGAQTEADVARLVEIGCRPDAIKVVGNMKFDGVQMDPRSGLNVPALLEQIGVGADAQILVCGSTHDGEEQLLAKIYQRLRQRYPKLFLILVPRHFERSPEVGRQLEKLGVAFAYRKEITSRTRQQPGEIECLLVNTTGELIHFYQAATVVFVGKSLKAKGGQNPIEPGALGKAMVFGPNMQNFADVARGFLAADGAMQVANANQLEETLALLLEDEIRREQLGANALKVVREYQGAIERTVEMIVSKVDSADKFLAPPKSARPAQETPAQSTGHPKSGK